jgi:exosortase/archaeosortase family protein
MTEIEYKDQKYEFVWWRIILFIFLAPLLSLLIYKLTELGWRVTHRPIVKQTVWVLNLITSDFDFAWGYNESALIDGYFYDVSDAPIPLSNIGFTTMCTGVQAIAIFAGIILMIPRSKNPYTNKSLWWRKLLSLVVSSAIFYVVNIARMVLQLKLYTAGWEWDDIHVSISAASSFIAALIIILMHRWIPEFIISIIWTLGELKVLVKSRKKPEVITN